MSKIDRARRKKNNRIWEHRMRLMNAFHSISDLESHFQFGQQLSPRIQWQMILKFTLFFTTGQLKTGRRQKYFQVLKFIKLQVLKSSLFHISLSFVGFYVSHAWWPRLLTPNGSDINDVIVSWLMFNIFVWWSLFCYACLKHLTAEVRNKWTHYLPCWLPNQVVPLVLWLRESKS